MQYLRKFCIWQINQEEEKQENEPGDLKGNLEKHLPNGKYVKEQKTLNPDSWYI